MNQRETRVVVGSQAGWCFHGQADMEVVFHCRAGRACGYYHVRKRLVDRAAFQYDPRMGWEVDRWFEWF